MIRLIARQIALPTPAEKLVDNSCVQRSRVKADGTSQVRAIRRAFAQSVTRFLEIDGPQRAAGFAYYAFFSLFPLLLLFVTIGSLFFDRETAIRNVIGFAETYFPLEPGMERGVFDTIVGVIESRGNVGAAAIIGLLWGSLQLFKALVRATSRAWHSDMHNWWQMPLKALALLGVLGSALILGLVAPVGVRLAEDWMPAMYGLASSPSDFAADFC